MDTTRKRQRRPTAGNLVVSAFFNRAAAATAVTIASIIPPGGSVSTAKAPKKKQSTAQPRPQIAIPPRGIGPVYEPNVNDVLSGRGGRINAHVGNVQYREIIAERKKDYLAKETKKLEKAHIAADIVHHIRGMDPSGRFLKEDVDGAWWDIGDARAIKKVGQALREDAPDIRGPERSSEDEEDIDKKVEAVKSPTKPKSPKKESPTKPVVDVAASAQPVSTTATTPTTANRRLTSTTPTTPSRTGMPGTPPITSKGSGGGKSAVAVSARGGHSGSSVSSGRSVHPNSSAQLFNSPNQHQLQHHEPMASYHIELRPPEGFPTIVPVSPQNYQSPQKISTPFYSNLGFRGMAPRAAVSGAAAAVMKQQYRQQNPVHEFEVPAARGLIYADEAFGRAFHSPPERHREESSIISGFSCGASALSGTSGISALTDSNSTFSHSSDINNHARAARQAMRLDQVRQNWASSAGVGASAMSSASTVQMLNASNGLGSSLNNTSSSMMRVLKEATAVDDSMSWMSHSLNDGGFARDDSVFLAGTTNTESIFPTGNSNGANYALGPATTRDDSFLCSYGDGISPSLAYGSRLGSSRHSQNGHMYRPAQHRGGPAAYYNPGDVPAQHRGGPAAYYNPGDGGSVTSMSMASTGVHSMASSIPGSVMSELSENLIALDLASHNNNNNHTGGGSILDQM